MEPSVNLDNLRTITDGDQDMEANLFRLFLESSNICMDGLRRAFAAGDDATWQQQAHALKGLCFNLGADPLGAICQKAQHDYTAPAEEKEQMLSAIQDELIRVREAIDKETT